MGASPIGCDPTPVHIPLPPRADPHPHDMSFSVVEGPIVILLNRCKKLSPSGM